jgi:hypothetical protein
VTTPGGTPGSSSALPSELELQVGAHFRAPITGAGSQGYRWTVEISGATGAVAVSTAGIPPTHDAGVGSFPRELRIDARAPGDAMVQLTLARHSGRVREQHVITVHVR